MFAEVLTARIAQLELQLARARNVSSLELDEVPFA